MSLPEGKRQDVTRGPSLNATRISSLILRLHEPCWVLHAGSCEHFFVVTNIRYAHIATVVKPRRLTSMEQGKTSCRPCVRVPLDDSDNPSALRFLPGVYQGARGVLDRGRCQARREPVSHLRTVLEVDGRAEGRRGVGGTPCQAPARVDVGGLLTRCNSCTRICHVTVIVFATW